MPQREPNLDREAVLQLARELDRFGGDWTLTDNELDEDHVEQGITEHLTIQIDTGRCRHFVDVYIAPPGARGTILATSVTDHGGRDGADGPATKETWFRALAHMLSFEMMVGSEERAKRAVPKPGEYPVSIPFTAPNRRALSHMKLPQQHVTLPLTYDQYQRLPDRPCGIVDALTVMDNSDGSKWTLKDARPYLDDLLTHWNHENPQDQYASHLADSLNRLDVAWPLLRTIAECCNYDYKFRPSDTGQTATQIMAYNGLDPDMIFTRAPRAK